MKTGLGLLLAAVLFAALPASAQDEAKVSGAEAAALSWLALTDRGDYGASWAQAATAFQGSISQANWTNALLNARTPLGALHSRKVMAARYARSLPGAPDGEYVVIQYTTEFEHKAGAVETVTPMLQPDGTWKVSGYFIR
jgi:hypothetical protein